MKSKRVLYVDISLQGHRSNYLKALVGINNQSLALLPSMYEEAQCEQIVMTSGYDKKRSIKNYFKWIKEIQQIAESKNVDCVHFLCGDVLYRFFGLGLNKIKKPIVVTYHHMLFEGLRDVSLKRIFNATDYGIVHTEYLKNELEKRGIRNVKQLEYPVFNQVELEDQTALKRRLNIPLDKICIVAIGATARYKGLDILLEALKKVSNPFYLYVAGTQRDFSAAYIEDNTATYGDSVKINIDVEKLSDEEYMSALGVADIIVLPYRFEFDGASGPMTEGVWARKYIIGAAHGSMGRIIDKHKLGKTFQTENADDLAKVLDEVLEQGLAWMPEAEHFRQQLTVETFLEKNRILYDLIVE